MSKSNSVITTAADAARLMVENKLDAQSLLVENSPAELLVVSVGVGSNPRAVLAWARYLDIGTIRTDRRAEDVTLLVEGVKDGVAWSVLGGYSKTLTGGARNRFPGITVEWERRPIGGTRTSRGTITAGQLEVLIGALGV